MYGLAARVIEGANPKMTTRSVQCGGKGKLVGPAVGAGNIVGAVAAAFLARSRLPEPDQFVSTAGGERLLVKAPGDHYPSLRGREGDRVRIRWEEDDVQLLAS